MLARLTLPALAAITALAAVQPVQAQEKAGPSNERVKQVIVYGDDPCPIGEGDEILVCARHDEKERYRILEQLRREEPGSTVNEAWGSRAKSIEYVGRTGTESCSPVGAGGVTGCFNQLAAKAKAERKQMGDKSWADLVAAEREKRLSKIDAESEQIEEQAKAEEAARAKREAQDSAGETPAPAAPATQEDHDAHHH